MLSGCTPEDYTVLIGNSSCYDVSVTDSLLECLPPREQPRQQSEGHIIQGAVQVVVGRACVIFIPFHVLLLSLLLFIHTSVY